MPPLSTNVIDDDDTSSYAISELNSDQFTHFGGDNDASSDSIPTVITPESSRKRRKLATSTWELARDPLPHEAIRDGKNRIWYCLMCEWNSASLTSVRAHLAKKHGIEIKAGEIWAKWLREECLSNILNSLQVSRQVEREAQEERILRAAINHNTSNEALVQLITTQNLPYNAVTWPKLHALLMTVNYTAEEVVINAKLIVPKLIEQSYIVHRDILKLKLQSSLSKIHISIDI